MKGICLSIAVMLACATPAYAVEPIESSLEHSKAYVQKDLAPFTTIEFGKLYPSRKGGGVICGSMMVTGSKKVSDGPQKFMETIGGLMFERDVDAARKVPFEPQWQQWCS